MDSVLSPSIVLGPLALIASLVGVVHYFLVARERGLIGPSFPLHVIVAVAWGVLGYFVGTSAGVFLACTSATSTNMCGLVGYFGFGPLLAGASLFICARTWAKGDNRAP